jgi:hypothetical protein
VVPARRADPARTGETWPGAAPELLDGGWWPRSTDPVAEIPGLVLAIDAIRGPITWMMLYSGDWESHPRRAPTTFSLARH